MTRVLAICAVDRPGGAEIGLERLIARRPGWQATVTTPPRLDPGGLSRGAGARAVLHWPRARRLARGHDVTYLNGTVAARFLPALRGLPTVLHVHDMVERVPGFWRAARVVLADSQAVADRLGGMQAHVVGCPVELDPPRVEAPWQRDGRPVVGFVGRIEPRKAPDVLVAAAPSIDARIVLVGDDAFGADPAYARRVLGSPGVEHVPWTDGAPGLMRHLDVLVLPSRSEPFGTVLAEAMAVGTPVVASRVDGLPEVVDDGVTGALVPPDDPGALAGGVLRVLERRDAMGAAAAARARRWDADVYAERVGALVEALGR